MGEYNIQGPPTGPQQVPVYFPGFGRFQDAEGVQSGAVGAIATVTININLRPQWLTTIRIKNVYAIPAPLQTIDQLTFLARLDGEQTVTTELTQSNIVVREVEQDTFTGRGGIHWHPLETPYPWSGGDNITLRFRRITAYPTDVFPGVHVTLGGIMIVKDLPGTNRA